MKSIILIRAHLLGDTNNIYSPDLNGNKIVAEEALALRLVAIIDVDFVYITFIRRVI